MLKKFVALASVGLAVLALAAAPASANNGNGGGNGTPTPTPTPTSVVIRPCLNTDISPTALACAGFFAGNVLSGNAGDLAFQTTQLNALGLSGNAVQLESIGSLRGSPIIDFNRALFGITYIGLHFGGGNGTTGPGEQSSVFYKFDARNGMNLFDISGLDEVLINRFADSSSRAVLFSTQVARITPAVPEPASWMMMILTVGFAGAALRRKRDGAAAADDREGYIPAGSAA